MEYNFKTYVIRLPCYIPVPKSRDQKESAPIRTVSTFEPEAHYGSVQGGRRIHCIV